MRKAWLSWGPWGGGAGSQPCPPPKSEPLRLFRVASGKGAQGWESFEGGGCSQKSSKGERVLCACYLGHGWHSLSGSSLPTPPAPLPSKRGPPSPRPQPLTQPQPPAGGSTHSQTDSRGLWLWRAPQPRGFPRGPPAPPQTLRAVCST